MAFKSKELSFERVISWHQRIIALMRRERSSRYAGGKLSGLWAYINPIFWIALVVGAFHLLGRVVPISTHPSLFVASGILPYAIFRQSITSIQRSLVANRFLPTLPGVTRFDILAATCILELFSSFVICLLTFGGIMLVYDTAFLDNVSGVGIGVCFAWMLGVSVGLLFLSIGRISDTFTRSVSLILRPMFWISGIFYISAELPLIVRSWLELNPLLHTVEYIRQACFTGYTGAVCDFFYPSLFSIICLSLAGIINHFVSKNKLDRHVS